MKAKKVIRHSRGQRRMSCRILSKYLKNNGIQDINHSTIFRFQKNDGAFVRKRSKVIQKCKNYRERRMVFVTCFTLAKVMTQIFGKEMRLFAMNRHFM
jgi:hypothetical protein